MDLKHRLRDRRHRILVRLARRGREDAFDRLYRELYGPVAGYIARRVRDRDEAQDLTAQVFQDFLTRLDRFDPGRGSVFIWVLAMARNGIIDHHRRSAAHGGARSNAISVDGVADLLPARGEDPLQSLILAEEVVRLDRLLQGQPPGIREMFALRFADGLRLREIAGVLGLGEEAVKQRFARTLRVLRQELTAQDLSTARFPDRLPARDKGGKTCATTD